MLPTHFRLPSTSACCPVAHARLSRESRRRSSPSPLTPNPSACPPSIVARLEQALDDFLRGASILGIDAETCKIFGQHRGRLRAKGKMVGDVDLLIGVTGLRHGLTVLTNNRRHFELIEGLPIESQ